MITEAEDAAASITNLSEIQLRATSRRQSSLPLTGKDYRSLIIIGLLSMVQGTSLGFCMHSMLVILAEKGIPYASVGVLYIAKSPSSFKFLFAPILDSYYSKKFGRRKTYLVPIEIILGFFFLYYTFTVEDLMNRVDITTIFIVNFSICLLLAIHNIAVQGLTIYYHGNAHSSFASASQVAGNIIGHALGYFVLVPLSSPYFCQKFFDSEREVVPIWIFMVGFSVLMFTVAFVVTVFVNEDNDEDDLNLDYITIARMFKGFIDNKYLRRYIIILLLVRLGYAPVESIFEVMLIRNGFQKEYITIITSLTLPVPLFFSFLVGKMFKRHNEWTGYMLGQFVHIVCYFYQIWLLSTYNSEMDLTTSLYLLTACYLLIEIGTTTFATAKNSFDIRISEKSIEGSYFTMLSSISRFGESWPVWLIPLFIDDDNFLTVQMIGGAFLILFWILNWRFLLKFQKIKKEELKISQSLGEKFLEMTEDHSIDNEINKNREVQDNRVRTSTSTQNQTNNIRNNVLNK